MIDGIEVEPEDYASMLTGYLQRADALPRELEWLGKLVRYQDRRIEEYRLLQDLIVQANSGMELSDILNRVYESFRPMIPFDRIGLALLERNGEVLRARWARTESTHICLKQGYAASMEGSSLERIVETRQPRILNDLEAYLTVHPGSASTALMIAEGIRSSLTCPLVGMGKPIGFLFFSSMKTGTYQNAHAEKFVQIALQISIIVQKARLYQDLKRTILRLRVENLEHKKTLEKLQLARNELELANQKLVQSLSIENGETSP